MSPTHELQRLGNAPALLVFEGSARQAAARGTLLFYHGFSAAKEANLKELNSLASHGFLAVGIDAVGHGQRLAPDFEYRFYKAPGGFGPAFEETVRQTAAEVPAVVDSLAGRELAHPGKLGIIGISMGGYIALGAVLTERRLSVATPILASPRWHSSPPDSPHAQPERFYPVALLTQNAGDDEHVPPAHAREFHDRLRPYYARQPERLCHVEFPGVGHFMPEVDWNRLWANVVGWFERWL